MQFQQLDKYVIGQNKIKPELSRFLHSCLNGNNYNFLIIGPSGYGKSHLVKVVYNILGIDKTIEYDPDDFFIDRTKEIHVIDEVHLVKKPELLYPHMDSKRFIFLLSTNLPGLLKEPLVNRCVSFYLDKYTDNELGEIIRKEIRLDLPDEYYNILGSVSRGNPRTAKIIATRVRLLFSEKGIPQTNEDLIDLLEELYIKEGGFTTKDFIYLDFLNRVKRASLSTISAVTRLDENVIKNDIEPFLISKGLIKITSRGRICY